MKTFAPISITGPAAPSQAHRGTASAVYHALMTNDEQGPRLGRAFLERQLQRAARLTCDLPETPEQLSEWARQGAHATSGAYQRYLEGRAQGQPRRYFGNRAHALYVLQAMAPTELVDGAWLYGLLPQWREQRFRGLIHRYLQRLGNGDPAQHPALRYKNLLAKHGCMAPAWLSDEHFVEGAQQLALGRLTAEYLPEVIGYSLGREQLPLAIGAFELHELDIDPYCFQAHLGTGGHAHKGVQAVLDNLPAAGDVRGFYRRVALGYRLNRLGLNASAAIAAFDLQRELLAMLERKRAVAGSMPSDFCRIGGRTVKQWLSQPGQLGDLLAALCKRGWIQRHRNPQHSHFWRLLQSEYALTFGSYERQLLHDWIAGDWLQTRPGANPPPAPRRHDPPPMTPRSAAGDGALDKQLRALDEPARSARLIELMAPTANATPVGLAATRLFANLLR
nr:iron-containing redox enzyme family protein [uncultured Pseudomonas sp.]